MGDQLVALSLGQHTLTLRTSPTVFQPNTTTRFLFEAMGDITGASVLDLGCGVAPIGIGAALSGAESVEAVDVMQEACALAVENAERNGVASRMLVKQGDVFSTIRDKRFDVIVCDVSGMADRVARLSPWYPASIPSGGIDGTRPTIAFLHGVRQHLCPRGRVIFPMLSLAVPGIIEGEARKLFGDQLVLQREHWIPFDPVLRNHLAELRHLRDRGLIDFQERRTRQLWMLRVYQAQI
jgi:SAM-dependent methyltransferase